MGRMSDLHIDMMNEQADNWIRERLDDEDADENSDQYQELSNHYDQLQEYQFEEAQLEAELEWLVKNDSLVIHNHLLSELNELKKVMDAAPSTSNNLIYKMNYAYAVTLLEAFLGDTVKSLVSENDTFFKNSMNIEELKNARYPLVFLVKNNVDARGLAIKELSNIHYHNIPKVKNIFRVILNKKINIDISELVKIVNIRHDIIHRDGKNKDGVSININKNEVLSAILNIEIFTNSLQKLILENA